MHKYLWLFFIIIFANFNTYAQDSTAVEILDYVKVSGSTNRVIKSIFNPIALIQSAQVVQNFNSIPGLRMEERSPGSYRINIRGSSQRAPFGIRNVKFYLNGIPFTEPGGNTYFNQLNLRILDYINIYKGPTMSEFGAGMGGVVSLNSLTSKQNYLQIESGIGSFRTWNTHLSTNIYSKKSQHYLSFSKEQSQGYRQHAAMEKSNFFWNPIVNFKKSKLSATFLFTDLWYQTPGGLNITQYQNDRKSARPTAGAFPSAAIANASIDQKNLLLGITFEHNLNDKWKLFSTLYTSKLELKNPTFRNYETRSEPHSGARAGIVAKYDFGSINAGFEFQSGNYNVKTFTNNNGVEGNLETNDKVMNRTGFGYLNIIIPANYWSFEAGYSANIIKTSIDRIENSYTSTKSTDIPLVHLPKFKIKNESFRNLKISGIVSKGYSPPSSSEVLPSNSIINTDLEAETGINYEIEIEYRLPFLKIGYNNIKLNTYLQNSKNTIVQRRDLSNADYYINAGATKQLGIEGSFYYTTFLKSTHQIEFNSSFNYTDYLFKDYVILNQNYSNHRMPGNMRWSTFIQASYKHKNYGSINLSHSYNDKMYLNDANTFSSAPYRIMSIGYQNTFILDKNKKHELSTRISIDNVLNQDYSLGFDFNAAANRFYNAAPGLQYFINLGYRFKFK